METQALLEKIVQDLTFEVEAVPKNDAELIQASKNVPMTVKIRVRKKEIPKKGQNMDITVKSPQLARLSSNQTVLSFDVSMGSELENNALNPPRHSFLSFWRTGTCTGAENEHHYPYMPTSSYYTAKLNNANQKGQLKQKITLTKNTDNRQVVKRTPTTFFGKCRPGGCLDPSGNEDIYSYQPTEYTLKSKRPSKARSNTPVMQGYTHSNEMPIEYSKSDKDNSDEHTISTTNVDDLHPNKSEPITLDKKYFSPINNIYEQNNGKESKRKSSVFDNNFFKKKRKSSLSSSSTKSSISHSSDRITKLQDDTSSTILTYPPLMQDDYITAGDDKIRTSESKPVKPFYEFSTNYYIRPKKADGVQESAVSGDKYSPTVHSVKKTVVSSNDTVGKAGISDNNINVLRTKLSDRELSANHDILETDHEKVPKDGKNLFLAPLPLLLFIPRSDGDTEESYTNDDLDIKDKTALSQPKINEPTINKTETVSTGKANTLIPANQIIRDVLKPGNSSREQWKPTKYDESNISEPSQLKETNNIETGADTPVHNQRNDYVSTNPDTDNITSENIQQPKRKISLSSKNNTLIPIPIPIPIPLTEDKNDGQQSNHSSSVNDYSNSKLSQDQIYKNISERPEEPNIFSLKDKSTELKNISTDNDFLKLQSPESKQSDNNIKGSTRKRKGSSETDDINTSKQDNGNLTYKEEFQNFALANKDGKPRINDNSNSSKLINKGDHIPEGSILSKDQDKKVDSLDNQIAKPSPSSFTQIHKKIKDDAQRSRLSDSSQRFGKSTKSDINALNLITSIGQDSGSKKSDINKTFDQNDLYNTKSDDTLKLSIANKDGDYIESESQRKQISKSDMQNGSHIDNGLADYTNDISPKNRDTITSLMPLVSNQINGTIVNRSLDKIEHPLTIQDQEINTTNSDKNSFSKVTQNTYNAQEPYHFVSSYNEIKSTLQHEPLKHPIVQENQINERLLSKTEELVSLNNTRGMGKSRKSMSDIMNDFASPTKTTHEYKTDENTLDNDIRLSNKARSIDTTSSDSQNGKRTRRSLSQEKNPVPFNKSFDDNVQNIKDYNKDADGSTKYSKHISGNIPSQDNNNMLKTFDKPPEKLSEINRHCDPSQSIDSKFPRHDKSKGLRTSEPTIVPKSQEIVTDVELKYNPNKITNVPEIFPFAKTSNEKDVLKPTIKSPNASVSPDPNKKFLNDIHTADLPKKRFSGVKKSLQKQESITANLAFQTYMNENNLREIKTFDPANDTGILAENSTVIKFQQLKLHENELRIPIDSKHDMAIHIKTPMMRNDQDIYQTHSETTLFSQPKTGKQVTIRAQEDDKSRTSYPHGSLEYLYEKELIPLQHTIRNLKKEIDALSAQQIAFKEKVFNTKKIEEPPLPRICKCLKNKIDKTDN